MFHEIVACTSLSRVYGRNHDRAMDESLGRGELCVPGDGRAEHERPQIWAMAIRDGSVDFSWLLAYDKNDKTNALCKKKPVVI